jgi:magnesium-transporting ATPase (P-type)
MDLIFQNESIIIPLDQRQLLLKGTKLRNTKWIIGIIIYTGQTQN